jgi:hypothetical protein
MAEMYNRIKLFTSSPEKKKEEGTGILTFPSRALPQLSEDLLLGPTFYYLSVVTH